MDRSIELRCLLAGFVVYAALALLAPDQAASQDKYITVDAKELVNAPHRYWARAILFRDKLVSLPAGRPVKVDRKRYIPFDTEIVGKCYAAATVVETLKKLETGRSYAFSGSVFQHRGRYYIIVHGVDKTIDAGEMLREMQALAPEIDPDIQERAVKPIADVVWTVESSHLAYAKEQDIPLCELYDPQSIHYSKAVELVRSAILEKEQDDSTVSSEMLAQYIVLALAKSCANTNLVAAGKPAGSIETQTQVPMPQPQLSTTEDSGQPEETDLGPAEKSAPPPMFTPPRDERPLSFWQRRRKLRAEKLKEKQARLEEEARLAEQQQTEEEKERARLARKKQAQEREDKEALAEQQRLEAEQHLAAQEEQRKAEEAKAAEQQRRLAEEADEATRLAAEKAERERILKEIKQREEAARLETERVTAEEAENKRLAEEQQQREQEAARQKAIAEEQAQLEAKRLAAEEAEKQRLAEEQAQEEAERIAAEEALRQRLAEEQAQIAAEEAAAAEEEIPLEEVEYVEKGETLSWWQRHKERRRIAAAEKAERRKIEEEEIRKRQAAWKEYLAEEEEARKATELEAQEQMAAETEVKEPVEVVEAEIEVDEEVQESPTAAMFDPHEMDRLRRVEEKRFREFQARQRREKARVERARKAMEREIQRKIKKYSQ